jgi:uncharacterized flavoprotein (TIGR03862 family)
MAAERLLAAGLDVTVYDRMRTPGRKLLVAGRGGLNLTHDEPIDDLLDRYGSARARLEPSIRAFDPDDLRAWARDLGQDTFIGTSRRVFPDRLLAAPLLAAWTERLTAAGADLRFLHRWTGWDGAAATFTTADGDHVVDTSDATVLAMGGASWPRTGSDGSWVGPVADAGVAVAPLRPANCGVLVDWSAVFRDRFDGDPVKNVGVTHDGRSARGEALVTTGGLEGGVVYALSAGIRDAVEATGSTEVVLDLRPDLTVDGLTERISRRRPKESTSTTLRRAGGLAAVAVGLMREATGNRLPDDPAALATLAKGAMVTVVGVAPLDDAISTAGGIALDEVDGSYMLRRRPGVFVAGEMLDWEAPTGGYLLQATFSTAVAAADGAVAWLQHSPG